jgi:hypothetical protein
MSLRTKHLRHARAGVAQQFYLKLLFEGFESSRPTRQFKRRRTVSGLRLEPVGVLTVASRSRPVLLKLLSVMKATVYGLYRHMIGT